MDILINDGVDNNLFFTIIFMTYIIKTLFIIVLLFNKPLFAIEDNTLQNTSNQVVVYGEVQEPQNQSKNIIVIDEDTIKQTQAKTLLDVLASVPGLSITSYGKYQNSSIYMKGASPHSTIILLNGVKLQDASSGAFDVGQIPLLAIERIEIIENGDGVS
jgi:vitamin B12 transporter